MPTAKKPISVLLVDDSPIALTALSRILATAPDIRVVGTARNGKDAIELVPRLDPDVVCTDLYMPVMDGLELTRELMARYPRPILVISVAVRSDEPHSAFQLLEAGAVDVIAKPRIGIDPANQELAEELIRKIRVLSGVVVFTKPHAPAAPIPEPITATERRPIRMVGIGASTGGPQALQAIFSQLPLDFPAPILCVQHIGAGFTGALIEWLAAHSRLTFRVATDGELPAPGSVYFPPEESDLELGTDSRLRVVRSRRAGHHYPRIDTTFTSLAERVKAQSAGVLLSGMGDDGARGMLAIARAGGLTIAQDEATSIVFGMPASAIANGSVRSVLPLGDIAGALVASTR